MRFVRGHDMYRFERSCQIVTGLLLTKQPGSNDMEACSLWA